MKVQLNRIAQTVGLCVGLLITGCSTTRVDWQARIGTYTYDQAVTDLGPPDKEATLTDGTRVADWLTHRGGVARVPVGPYYYGYGPWCYAPIYPAWTDYYVPNYYLRLVFDAQGHLTKWKKFAR